MKSKEIKIKDCIGIILIFLVFNFIISLNVKILAINPDEINVLAIPAKLSGNKWYLVNIDDKTKIILKELYSDLADVKTE